MRKLIVVALALVFAAGASAGEVYKWVDKDGRVHYGDKPKTGEGQQVEPKPGNLPGEAPDPETQASATARQAACDSKKKQLESYKAASVIKQTDALGQTTDLTPEQRAKFIALTEQEVAKACAPPPPPG